MISSWMTNGIRFRAFPESVRIYDVRQIMLLTVIKALDTTFTAVQQCLLPNFFLDSGKCMPTVKSLVSASPGCSLCLVYSPGPEYFSRVGCHKMAFCSQIKAEKNLSCLPFASEMYRHSMALNSACRRLNKLSDLKKFKFVFLRATIGDQEGGVNSSARAYPMIVAIVTSRSVKRGILLSFENGAGDVVGC